MAMEDAAPIIDYLNSRANDILSRVIKSNLVSFTVGSQGMFPYYWTDPDNLLFNSVTYDWINSSLKAGITPVMLDDIFVNRYNTAINDVKWSLSSADQEALNKALDNATDQQGTLLALWSKTYGGLPTDKPAIDAIVSKIANDWASPKTNLWAMQQSTDLNELLNLAPASGRTKILPALAKWLSAIGDSISLQNSVTMNFGYLHQALTAAKHPSNGSANSAANNGGLALNDGRIVPNYQVSTPISDILNGLKDTKNSIDLLMDVTRSTSSEFRVSVQGGASFDIPVADFLSLDMNGSASYFHEQIAKETNSVHVEMNYGGVTWAEFGPVDYEESTGLNWFWMSPIQDAIKNTITNGDQDVSGFKFSPTPEIDFSASGPFGFLTTVAFSNFPSMTITVVGTNYQQISNDFTQGSSVGISFLGIPLGGASESTYSKNTQTDETKQQVTITLSPPAEMIAGSAVDSRGWILGVVTNYPAASSPLP